MRLTLVGLEAEYRLRVSVTSSARLQTALHADPFISGENPLYWRIALEKGRKPIYTPPHKFLRFLPAVLGRRLAPAPTGSSNLDELSMARHLPNASKNVLNIL